MTTTGKVLAVLFLVGSVVSLGMAGAQAGATLSSRHLAFAGPTGVLAAGGHVWVTNVVNSTVTELDASNGSVLQVVGTSKQDEFATPIAIAVSNGVLWVANFEGNSASEIDGQSGSFVKQDPFIGNTTPAAVTATDGGAWFANAQDEDIGDGETIPYSDSLIELSDTTGTTIRTVAASVTNGLDSADSIVDCADNLWAANPNMNTVSEFSAATGAFVRVVSGDGISRPADVACDKSQVWVLNSDADQIVVLRASDGTLLRTIQNADAQGASSVAFDRSRAWVTNPYDNTVAEFDVTTGSLVRLLDAKADDFSAPMGVAVTDGHVWVANQYGNSVTELSEKTGAVQDVIRY
jgi:streptogramin lyase